MPGFTELFLRLFHDEGQVRIARGGQGQCLLQPDLPGRAEQQIGAPHHVRHMLRGIVDDYSELIGDNFVLALDDNIAQLGGTEPAVPLY